MMTSTQTALRGLISEGNGWMTRLEHRPDLTDRPAAELLKLTSALRENARYGRLSERYAGGCADRTEIVLICEVRALTDGVLDAAALARLSGPFLLESMGELPDDESVETALEASGHTYARRDDHWVVPPIGGMPREMVVRRIPGGISVAATLVEWEPDALGPVAAEALAELMLATHIDLRFARCELDDRRARVVSHTDAESMETDILHSLLGVTAACRLIAREATALLTPDLARAYLNVRRASSRDEENRFM
jgi:hypothetical protein